MSKNTRTLVPISMVIPDENQPRKFFPEDKLKQLQNSIKKHGIMNPLLVQEEGEKFMLVDGERRYRAAKELGIKEVPITVLPSRSREERAIEQFHIQEMHEGWTPIEKANVIVDLAQTLNKPFTQVCAELGIHERTARKYYHLTKILAKDDFDKKNISMEFAPHIVALTNFVKKLKAENDDTFTLTDQRKLEKEVISRIADNTLQSSFDVTRLKDTFTADEKMIDKFMDGASLEEMFTKSKARAAYHLRNVANGANHLTNHIAGYMKRMDVKPTEMQISLVRRAHKIIGDLLKQID